MGENASEYFGAGDIIVFAGTLVLSGLIGIFFSVKDRKNGLENYYYGGKNMHPVPLGTSIAVTFISALTVIAIPTEAYVYGLVTLWFTFHLAISIAVACIYYIPLMHKLQLDTIYQYLELRFHPVLRRIVSACEILSMLCYMGVSVFVPALALSAVTPISMQWSILLTSSVCTLYTTFGGIKAIVWTDVVQAVVIFIGVLAALIKTTIVVGGMSSVYQAMERSGRNNLFEFNPDPTIRSTFWTILIGYSMTSNNETCTNQSIYQRYLACKTVNGARMAAISALIPKMIITSMAVLSGCAAYAYFEGCDPLDSGKITKKDQLMPYLVLVIFRETPGMAGFFVAAAYSGTMSTFSSGINAVSMQLLEDFIVPRIPNFSNTRKLILAKITVFGLGVTVTAVAFAASALDGTVLSMIMTIRGAFMGPILGIYTLGVFFPWSNTKGAMVGHLVSTILMVWIGLGGLLSGRSPETQREKPTSTDLCLDFNPTSNLTTSLINNVSHVADTSTAALPSERYYNPMFAVSLLYTSCMGMMLTVIIGLIVSFCTGPNDPKKLDPTLFSPFLNNRLLPKQVRSFFRFGVPETISTSRDAKIGVLCSEKGSNPLKNSDNETLPMTSSQLDGVIL